MILIATRGRKTILTKEQAQNIVNEYIVEFEQVEQIKYIEIHRYCELLFSKGLLETIPQESFWRKKDRLGRKVIDATNNILADNINLEISERNYNQFMKILQKDTISSSNLKMISNELSSHFITINAKDQHINQLIDKNKNLENEIQNLQKTNNLYYNLLINVYHFMFKRNTPANNKVFMNAFDQIFSNPPSYIDSIEPVNKEESTSIISSIFKNKLK